MYLRGGGRVDQEGVECWFIEGSAGWGRIIKVECVVDVFLLSYSHRIAWSFCVFFLGVELI